MPEPTPSAAPEIALSARSLTRRFGDFTAVDGIDLELGRGEIFGFLGPNGAGKTTTIRILCGILTPTSGTAHVLGHDVARDPEAVKKRIGYVSQQFGLYGDLSVDENVRFYADIYGATDRAYREHLLEHYGFKDKRRRLAGALSGGFKQRLALVCALTHKPKLVFLDEPTAGVDPVTRKELWDLFYSLTADGTTLFVTTHYMEEAERCDRVAFIFRGKLVLNDAPDRVKAHLGERDLFHVRCRYDPELVRRARELPGVETVNQFGTTLRLIVERGRLTPQTLAAALGNGEITAAHVYPTEPTMEDVFVNLTSRLAAEAEAQDDARGATEGARS